MTLTRAFQLIMRPLARLPVRARWSFIDQVMVSGVNFLGTIILVRSLGLETFGVFSMVTIGVQFLAGIQGSAIMGPMMSLYDQRGEISRSSYLATILLHQTVACAGTVLIAIVAAVVVNLYIAPSQPIDFILVALFAISVQIQDLARRFFYVTERPISAFASDFIAYAVRFAILAALAFAGAMTLETAWFVTIVTGFASMVLLVPDLAALDTRWAPIKEVTQRHMSIAGWMAGNRLVGWFSDADFFLLVLGGILGPAQLGAVRAVQSVVLVVNLLLQSLENFVPSAASKALMQGGGKALIRYTTDMSLYGAIGIAAVVAVLMLLLDPITMLMFGRAFPDALVILLLLGAHQALVHVTMVTIAGLRALQFMRGAFVAQVVVAAFSFAAVWYPTQMWGAVGTLATLLAARFLLTSQLVVQLRRKAAAA